MTTSEGVFAAEEPPFCPVAVFAHNEAGSIESAMSSIVAAGLGTRDVVQVLVKGSTDDTLARVRTFTRHDPRFHPVEIALGDKANAWDVYVHRTANMAADMHFFIDGDMQISPGAFNRVDMARADHPEARAFATLPQGGRQATSWSARILDNHGLPGCFYALTGATMRRLRDKVWLPVGFMGDDTLLRWLLLRDLDPAAAPVLANIRPVPEAFFRYESFPINTLAGLGRLWRRHLGYTRREVQFHALKAVLSSEGLAAKPHHIAEIYPLIRPLRYAREANVGFRGRRLLMPFVARQMRNRYLTATPMGPAWFDLPLTQPASGVGEQP